MLVLVTMYFGGAHFSFDAKLSDNPTLAAHFIHSVLQIMAADNRIASIKGATEDEFYVAYSGLFDSIVSRYKVERGYEIGHQSIRLGIRWFLKTSMK